MRGSHKTTPSKQLASYHKLRQIFNRFFVNRKGSTMTGKLDVGDYIRTTGSSTPASGEGLEIYYSSNTGYLLAYDRTGLAFKPLILWASSMNMYIESGVARIGGAANYLQIADDGELSLAGTATYFEDVQFPISNARVPSVNFPTWEAFTTNTKEYSFTVNDYIDTQANELLHSWKLATTANVHLHVTTKAANATGFDRFAKFTVTVAKAKTGAAWNESDLTAELTIPDGTLALQEFYLDMGDIDMTGYTLGSRMKLRVKRITATGGTEYSGNIFINQAGIHIENDNLGSDTELTK